jgi:hypothetical protein
VLVPDTLIRRGQRVRLARRASLGPKEKRDLLVPREKRVTKGSKVPR